LGLRDVATQDEPLGYSQRSSDGSAAQTKAYSPGYSLGESVAHCVADGKANDARQNPPSCPINVPFQGKPLHYSDRNTNHSTIYKEIFNESLQGFTDGETDDPTRGGCQHPT